MTYVLAMVESVPAAAAPPTWVYLFQSLLALSTALAALFAVKYAYLGAIRQAASVAEAANKQTKAVLAVQRAAMRAERKRFSELKDSTRVALTLQTIHYARVAFNSAGVDAESAGAALNLAPSLRLAPSLVEHHLARLRAFVDRAYDLETCAVFDADQVRAIHDAATLVDILIANIIDRRGVGDFHGVPSAVSVLIGLQSMKSLSAALDALGDVSPPFRQEAVDKIQRLYDAAHREEARRSGLPPP